MLLCTEHVEAEWRHVAVQGGGVHGNAMLSRFDMSDCRAIEHRCGDFHNLVQDKSHHPSHLHLHVCPGSKLEPANTS